MKNLVWCIVLVVLAWALLYPPFLPVDEPQSEPDNYGMVISEGRTTFYKYDYKGREYKVWVAGEMLTADDMNMNFDQIWDRLKNLESQ